MIRVLAAAVLVAALAACTNSYLVERQVNDPEVKAQVDPLTEDYARCTAARAKAYAPKFPGNVRKLTEVVRDLCESRRRQIASKLWDLNVKPRQRDQYMAQVDSGFYDTVAEAVAEHRRALREQGEK